MISNPLPSRNWHVYGADTKPDSPLILRAGPLHLLYEPGSGFVRRICLGEREILRGVYAAVRDRNWGTVPSQLTNLGLEVSDEGFSVRFQAECRKAEIHFVWQGYIRGSADGSLRYEFDGEARTTFLRNRVGFCVLHPSRECAGAAARQTRVDGTVVEGRFPQTIEPQIFGQSSFRDLRKLAHEVAPDLWAEVEFEGDVFEMEDQRNWTDASFKTYCTPLTLPFPVEIKAGTRIRQAVTLRLLGNSPVPVRSNVKTSAGQPELVTITVPEHAGGRCPDIGLGLASHGEALTEVEIARLRSLRLRHLRVDLRLSNADWPATWERARRESDQLGVALELAVHLPQEGVEGLTMLSHRLRNPGAQVARVLALREGEPASSPATLRPVREALASLDVPFGAGTDSNFCELNREQALGRLATSEADFIFWSMNPQVHAFDNLSLTETLDAQAATVLTARTFAQGKPLVISPLTLKPRFNAVATGASAGIDAGELPPQVDPRQLSLFAAAWTLGSLAALAGAGAESITCFETTGWRGVMEREKGPALPEKFPSLPGAVFPLYHVLLSLAGSERLAPVEVSDPSKVAAVSSLNAQGHHSIVLGNLTSESQHVRLVTSMASSIAHWLTTESVLFAMRQPERFRAQSGEQLTNRSGVVELALQPYAVGRIE